MTRDDILRMAQEAGWFFMEAEMESRKLQRFAAFVGAAEREQCAKVCENKNTLLEWPTYATAIRARSAV